MLVYLVMCVISIIRCGNIFQMLFYKANYIFIHLKKMKNVMLVCCIFIDYLFIICACPGDGAQSDCETVPFHDLV